MKLCVWPKQKMGCRKVRISYQSLSKEIATISIDQAVQNDHTGFQDTVTHPLATRQDEHSKEYEHTLPVHMHIPCSDDRLKTVTEVHVRKLK